MSKNSRKKRRRNNRERKHDFVSTIKVAPEKSKRSVVQTQRKSTKPLPDTTLSIQGQRADIITTLTLAGIIITGFVIIAIAENQAHFLTQLGKQMLGSVNITL